MNSREFLTLKFICAKCGEPQQVTYDKPRNEKSVPDVGGLGSVAISAYVEPCKECLKPLIKAKMAIKTLSEI